MRNQSSGDISYVYIIYKMIYIILVCPFPFHPILIHTQHSGYQLSVDEKEADLQEVSSLLDL